jgi:hypothetical protein
MKRWRLERLTLIMKINRMKEAIPSLSGQAKEDVLKRAIELNNYLLEL